MPLVSDACLPAPDLACSTLYRVANHLLCKLVEAVGTCFVGGSCEGQLQAYVTTGQGDDGITDQLTVALLQIDPSQLSVAGGPSLRRAGFLVRLHESGWPTAQIVGTEVVPPDPATQDVAVQQLLAHGEAMERRLTHLQATNTLAPPDLPQLRGEVGQFVPVFPSGGVAGWTVVVTVNMPWGM